MKCMIFAFQALVLTAVATIAAAGDGQNTTLVERTSKGWELVQVPIENGRKPRCEVRSPDGRIIVINGKLYIYYRGENRSQNGQYKIDDREMNFYGNPTPTGPYFKSAIFEGDGFDRIMKGRRLRVDSVIVGGGVEREDIDIGHIKPLVAKLKTC